MTTRLVYSKGVFGNGYTSGSGSGGSSCSLRRGTLASATWTEEAAMYASVLLDGNEEASTFKVDWQMDAGQRVAVLFFGAQALVLPVASAIIEQALAQAGEDMQAFVDALKEEIEAAKAEVEADLAELNTAFDDFKANHQLTDSDIALKIEQTETSLLTQITGAIQTAEEAYTALTALEQTVSEISLTASEKYESYDQGMADLQAQITLASNAITQEVSDRREAVEGAIADLTSLVTQTADGIRSEVSGTYATQEAVGTLSTTVTQLEDSLTAEITTALEKADDAARTATDFLEFSSDGLTLGHKEDGSYTGYRTRMTSDAFQVLDESENVLSSFGADEVLLGNSSTEANISLCGNSMVITGSATGGAGSVANSKGASYSFVTLDGTMSWPVLKPSFGSREYIVGSALAATSTTDYQQVIATYCAYSNDSGTTGSFELSVSANNVHVKGLVFIYGDGSRYLSQTLWDPNNRYVTLERTVYNSSTGTVYMANAVYLVSGTNVTRQESLSGSADISSGSTSVAQSDVIRVYAVLAIM